MELLKIDFLPQSAVEANTGKARLSAIAESVVGMEEDAIFQYFVANFLRSDRKEVQDLITILDRVRVT